MIARLVAIAACLLLPFAAQAQTPKTKAQLQSEITSSFPNNTTGAITPLLLRNVLSDIVNGYTTALLPNGKIFVGNSSGVAATFAPVAGFATFDSNGNISSVPSIGLLSALGGLPIAGGTMTGPLILSGNPQQALAAAPRQYVDALAAGLAPKVSVVAATTTNGTLASAYANGSTIDTVVLTTGDRILIKDQSAQAENGIYTVNASGAPTRSTDLDTWAEAIGAATFVTGGSVNIAKGFVAIVTTSGTINFTAMPWTQNSASIAYTAGSGLLLSTSVFSVDAGTSGHKIPFLDGPNIWSGVNTFSGGAVVPTQTLGDNTTNAASTAFVQTSLVTDPVAPLVTANTTLTLQYKTILVDTTAGAVFLTLPAISGASLGHAFIIKKISTDANALTINVSGGANIGPATSFVIKVPNTGLMTTANATGWKLTQSDPQIANARLSFGALGDGTTDDTVNLTKFFYWCALAVNARCYIPGGTYLTNVINPNAVNGSIHGMEVYGDGIGLTTIKMKNANNAGLISMVAANTIASGSGNFDIHFHDMTFDGNGTNQTVNNFVFAAAYVKNFIVERVEFKNPFGNLLWLSETDTFGGGAGGIPTPPLGQQFNFNVRIRDNVFDGTGQQPGGAGDMIVISAVDDLVVSGNSISHAIASIFSFQWDINFSIKDNTVKDFARGLYMETNQKGEVSGNKFTGLKASPLGDIPNPAIWCTTADSSYPAAGYAGCQDTNIHDNAIYSLTKPGGGTSAIYGIQLTAPAGALASEGINVHDNSIMGFSGGTGNAAVFVEGTFNLFNASHNRITATGAGISMGSVYVPSGFGGMTMTTINSNHMSSLTTGVTYSAGIGGGNYSVITGNICVTVSTCITPGAQANIVNTGNLP